jgi:hypothetical protein
MKLASECRSLTYIFDLSPILYSKGPYQGYNWDYLHDVDPIVQIRLFIVERIMIALINGRTTLQCTGFSMEMHSYALTCAYT